MASIDTHEAPLKSPPQAPRQPSSTTKENTQASSIINEGISFISQCSSRSRVALACAFLAALHVFFGRLLFLIVGFVGGVILHAWWEESNSCPDGEGKNAIKQTRRDLGLAVAQRLMNWEGASTTHFHADAPSTSESDFSDLNPATATALDAIVDAVISGYVR